MLRSMLSGGFDLMGFLKSLLMIAPAAVIAVTFHEVAHGFVAYKLGDPTAKNMGRLSLNPIGHFDLFGFLSMMFVGFGWAKPVPINPYYFKKPKRDTALVSLAGPAANLLVAVATFIIYVIIMGIVLKLSPYALLDGQSIISILLMMIELIFSLNITLMVFNLIPIPPLDGSKVLFSLLPHKAYGFVLNYERYGMIILVALLFAGVLDRPLGAMYGVFDNLFQYGTVHILSLVGVI